MVKVTARRRKLIIIFMHLHIQEMTVKNILCRSNWASQGSTGRVVDRLLSILFYIKIVYYQHFHMQCKNMVGNSTFAEVSLHWDLCHIVPMTITQDFHAYNSQIDLKPSSGRNCILICITRPCRGFRNHSVCHLKLICAD